MDWPTITAVIVAHSHVRARAINVRFELIRDRDREIRKIDRQNQRREHALLVPVSPSIFQINFQKQVGHTKTRLPDLRLCQPARPYLLRIITDTPESILPILPSAIFKKWQNGHTNTHTPRFSHKRSGAKVLH